MKTYFKVVAIDMNPSLFYSAMSHELPRSFILTYKVGEITVPGTGRIFIFESLKEAKYFSESMGRTRIAILEGHATLVRKTEWVCCFYNDEANLLKFWKESNHNRLGHAVGYKQSRFHVYTCSSFTPTNVVVDKSRN